MCIDDLHIHSTQIKTLLPSGHDAPKVSIGMPVYNGAPFIREALESLINQTYTNFELIISDNASTDQTGIICQEYAGRDSRIRYVLQNENLGAISNFQFVLDEAAGKYFMWAAADDCWSQDWLYDLTVGLNHGAHACSVGNICYIDAEGKKINQATTRGGYLTKFPLLDNCNNALRRVLKFFLNRNDMLVYGLFRTNQAKSVQLVKGIYSDLPHDQIYAFLYHQITFGGIYISNNCTIFKRVHSAQASHNGPKNFFEQYQINNNHIFLTSLYTKNSSLNFIERRLLAIFMYLYLNASLIKNWKNIFS
jgi:glycosyltransferase involved in cell wall biosynthesis